jgi:hypothetical protein
MWSLSVPESVLVDPPVSHVFEVHRMSILLRVLPGMRAEEKVDGGL